MADIIYVSEQYTVQDQAQTAYSDNSPEEAPTLSSLLPLSPEGLGGVGEAFGRARMRTFITLRWMAVIGQTLAVCFVAYILDFELPLRICLAVIAASAWLNIFLTLAFPIQRLASQSEAVLQLGFDILQVTVLIALTGGLANPFALMIIAPITVAATSLRPVYAVLLCVVGIVCLGSMPLFSLPLPWHAGEELVLPDIYYWGLFSAFTTGLIFFALSALRISQDEARLVRALDAAQVVLAREQKLSALGSLAAATAHELGTPLATIHLAAKEMSLNISKHNAIYEDVHLLVEQAERCQIILRQLSQKRETSDIIHAQMPLPALLQEAAAPHGRPDLDIEIICEATKFQNEKPPILRRSVEILHALGAFIENACSFAKVRIIIHAKWSHNQIEILVHDDGPGFHPSVLPRLGEPYVSLRSSQYAGGGDMGLGFFIAKTLIERTDGRISAFNWPEKPGGAAIKIIWPRKVLEIDRQ